MKSLSFAFIVLASFVTLFSVADARRFYVGGNGAWVVNPRESYNTWAERNRFQVNDTLYFKYAKGSDSVQRVMKEDYNGCNVRNPLEKFDNGEAEFTLNRSGPFYFISGNKENCMKGQKLIVVVLAIRHNPKVPVAPAKAPSTAQPPKAHSPVSPPAKAPSTAQPPKSNTPVSPVAPAKAPSTAETPKAHSPVSPTSPAKSPSTVTPPPTSQPPKSSVSPSHAPTMSPATHSPPSKSPSPSTSSPQSPPSSSPSPKSPSPASSPSSSTSSPTKPPTSSPLPNDSPATPAPEKTPPSSPTPSGSTPAADNIKAPAPSPRNAASGMAVTSVLTTVLSVAFTVLMFA